MMQFTVLLNLPTLSGIFLIIIQLAVHSSLIEESIDCVMLPFFKQSNDTKIIENVYVKLITSCGEFEHTLLDDKCQNTTMSDDAFSSIPVFNERQNLSYQNVYCALCHNNSFTELVLWSSKLSRDCGTKFVDSSELLTMTIFSKISSQCTLYFDFKQITTCEADTNIYTKQNVEDSNEPRMSSNRKTYTDWVSITDLIDFTIILRHENLQINKDIIDVEKRLDLKKTDANETVSSGAKYTYICSMICVSCSMLSTIMFGLVLLTKKEIATKNAAHLFILCVCIFFTHLMYIIITLQYSVKFNFFICRSIAVLNYFFNFATSHWSMVISLDICHMLGNSSHSVSHASNRRFRCHAVTSFLSALVLTMIACGIDFISPIWPYAPHFGTITCWINSTKGHLLWFYCPQSLVFATNFVLFSLSAFRVKSASQKRLNLRSTRKPVFSYTIIAKIALITGLPKVVSLTIVFLTPNSLEKDIFNGIYSVIDGLQGVFVIGCFFMSKKVRASLFYSSSSSSSKISSNRTR